MLSPEAARRLRIACVLFLAALAQTVFAQRMQIGFARPDFLSLAAVLCALNCSVAGGAAVGFFAGLGTAAIASPPAGYGSIIVSTTLVCAGIGWLEQRLNRESLPFGIGATAAGLAAIQLLFFVFAPQHNTLQWARSAAGVVLYDVVASTALLVPVSAAARLRPSLT